MKLQNGTGVHFGPPVGILSRREFCSPMGVGQVRQKAKPEIL